MHVNIKLSGFVQLCLSQIHMHLFITLSLAFSCLEIQESEQRVKDQTMQLPSNTGSNSLETQDDIIDVLKSSIHKGLT